MISRAKARTDIRKSDMRTNSSEHWMGYATDNNNETYTISYKLNSYIRNNNEVSKDNLYGYTFACTQKECESDKKTFTSGNVWNKIDLKGSTGPQSAYSLCGFGSNPDAEKVDATIVEGRIDVGPTLFNAVRITAISNGFINCGGERVGKGSKVQTKIIIADKLPRFETIQADLQNLERFPSVTTEEEGCDRTVVFEGSEVCYAGKVISGQSTEMASFDISGDVKTVEEWEKAKEEIEIQREKLALALKRAKENVDKSRADYERATLAKEKAETQVTVKDAEYQQATQAYNSDPTEETLKAKNDAFDALDKAREIVKKREDAEVAAKKVYDSYKGIYDNALIDKQSFDGKYPF